MPAGRGPLRRGQRRAAPAGCLHRAPAAQAVGRPAGLHAPAGRRSPGGVGHARNRRQARRW
ncbi:hypothetical protein DY245_15565 [Streptomyces inhibens]|uniref:Uncharacterized protein n=1 Tax=Streptomyces inhibens TaxID=2293571 RepID=A0A371Q455_STRIH|nr:hypothetical protein DY245_15565 [Streptomyces inhibens]